MSEYKNVEDPFIKAVNEQVAENKAATVAEEPLEEIVDNPIVPETTEEETPQVEVPEETPEETEPQNVDDPSVEDEPPVEEEPLASTIEEWDEPDTPEVEDTPTEFDYSAFSKEIGLEATSKEELVNKVKEMKSAVEVASQDPLADLPSNLRQAVEIAKLDGDYLEYLGVTSVDYSQVDPAILVQNQYAQILTDADGNVDTEKLADILEGMSDVEIEVQGKRIQQELISKQEQFKQNVQREAQAAKQQADIKLKEALNDLKEVRGFKLNSTHRKQLYDDISSGKIIQDLFYTNGEMDYKKVAEIVFERKKGEQMHNFLRQQITANTKKELIGKISNKTAPPKQGELPKVDKVARTAQDDLVDHLKGLANS